MNKIYTAPMKSIGVGILLIITLFLTGFLMFNQRYTPTPAQQNPHAITYVAVGDSYTVGLDVNAEESWPALLTSHLRSDGIEIELLANLGVTGYTTEDVIAYELPELKKLKPKFATLLIGANDTSFAVDVHTYRKNLQIILDTILSLLEDKENLVVLTIPDYINTPRGKTDFSTGGYKSLITEYNNIIKDEAKKRNLTIVDLYDINDGINEDGSYYTADGLHPSAKQYQLWEKRIYPVVKKVLQK